MAANLIYMAKQAWTDILDALRAKLGTQTLYKAGEVPALIQSIRSRDLLAARLNDELEEYESDEVTDLPYAAFYNAAHLKSINIPNCLSFGSNSTFYGCTMLKTIHVADGISDLAIPSSFARNCSSLETITGPASYGNIAGSAFSVCSRLDASDMLDKTTGTLGSDAFASTGTTIAKIRGSSMGASCFKGCTSLSKMWLSSALTTIIASSQSGSPVQNCTALTDIYCEAASKPSGWGTYFNKISSSQTATVHYGVTEADFDALIG